MGISKLLVSVYLAFVAASASASDLNQRIDLLATLVNVGSNGGDASVYDYDAKSFDEKQRQLSRIAQLSEWRAEGDNCSMVASFEIQDATGNVAFFGADEAKALFRQLVKEGAVRAVNGYDWDGDEGDSEYCSRGELEIYFTNGKVLSISHDSTT